MEVIVAMEKENRSLLRKIDENFFNNEIIYYLLTVEQYRSLHIHSKDSLKHGVVLKMHVLTVVKSTILYVLTQDLHWHYIYIKK